MNKINKTHAVVRLIFCGWYKKDDRVSYRMICYGDKYCKVGFSKECKDRVLLFWMK